MKRIDCYRTILQQELLARKAINARYSQAAFARDLQLAPPKLSQILSNQCGLSRERAMRVARNLGFNEEETQYFVSLVLSQHARRRATREEAKQRAQKLAQGRSVTVTQNQFALLKDWYHFAILNLLRSKTAQKDAKSLSKRLQLPVSIVRESLELLGKLGLLNKDSDEALVKTTQDIPSRAIRHHHEQVIHRTLSSLQKDSLEDREFQSLMFLAKPKQMPQMKKKLRKQNLQFLNEFEDEKSEDLYALSVQLVPVTKKGQRE